MNPIGLSFKPIAQDQDYQTVSIPAGGSNVVIASVPTRIGMKPWLVALRNAVDSSGLGKIRFKTQINGSFAPPPYDFTVNQWADPAADVWIPVPFEIPQGCTVQVVADNSDGANAYNATARIIVVYQSISDALKQAGYQ